MFWIGDDGLDTNVVLGGWGVRKPITNPFKESFETPSNLTNPKEKGVK